MAWDKTIPVDSTPTFQVDNLIRDFKSDFRTIFSTEHNFPAEGEIVDVNTNKGTHKEGSGRVYITNSSSPPTGNYPKGVLCWCNGSSKLFVRTSSGWEEVRHNFPYDVMLKIDQDFTTETIFSYTNSVYNNSRWLVHFAGAYGSSPLATKYDITIYSSYIGNNVFVLPASLQTGNGFMIYFGITSIQILPYTYRLDFKILTGGNSIHLEAVILIRRVYNNGSSEVG